MENKKYLAFIAFNELLNGENDFQIVNCSNMEDAEKILFEKVKSIYKSYELKCELPTEEQCTSLEEYHNNINKFFKYKIIKEVDNDFNIEEYIKLIDKKNEERFESKLSELGYEPLDTEEKFVKKFAELLKEYNPIVLESDGKYKVNLKKGDLEFTSESNDTLLKSYDEAFKWYREHKSKSESRILDLWE